MAAALLNLMTAGKKCLVSSDIGRYGARMVRDRRTGRGLGLAMMLTVCDKDRGLAARLRASFINTAVLSSGLMNRAGKKGWICRVTPAAGSQGHLVTSACLPVLLVIVNTHVVPRSDQIWLPLL